MIDEPTLQKTLDEVKQDERVAAIITKLSSIFKEGVIIGLKSLLKTAQVEPATTFNCQHDTTLTLNAAQRSKLAIQDPFTSKPH